MKLIAKYLDALEANEVVIERLYLLYSGRFTGNADFWNTLAQEERMHASIINLLLGQIEMHEVTFVPGDLVLSDILTIVEKANKHCDQLEEGGRLNEKAALEMAVDLESGMLEHGFFDFFDGGGQAFQDDMAALKKHTEEHLQRIKEKLEHFTIEETSEMPMDEGLDE